MPLIGMPLIGMPLQCPTRVAGMRSLLHGFQTLDFSKSSECSQNHISHQFGCRGGGYDGFWPNIRGGFEDFSIIFSSILPLSTYNKMHCFCNGLIDTNDNTKFLGLKFTREPEFDVGWSARARISVQNSNSGRFWAYLVINCAKNSSDTGGDLKIGSLGEFRP